MAAAVKPPPPGEMNRQSWQAQKAIREIDEWRHWINDSADNFITELAALKKKKEMPPEDQVNLANVQEQLVELKKLFRPLEKSIHTATGRRIQRARRRT